MADPFVTGVVVGVLLVFGVIILTAVRQESQRSSCGPARAEPRNQRQCHNRPASFPSSPNRQRRSFQDKGSCTICLQSLDIRPVRTSCGHVFHNHCIENWMGESPTCPLCRAPLVQ